MWPQKEENICFDKAQYIKEGNSENKITASKRKFLAFSPNWSELQKKLQNTANTLHELDNVIKEDIKGSCLWEMMDGRSISR